MRYLILSACERLDPRAVWGRAWDALYTHEQHELLGYTMLRAAEDAQQEEQRLRIMAGHSTRRALR